MNERKKILIISALDFWSMGEGKGGPALYRTLTGYAERGWDVWFITGNKCQADCNPPMRIYMLFASIFHS